MTLSEFLAEQKMTRAQFAALVQAHPVTVSKWCSGAMRPRDEQMDAITRATRGSVTANDMHTARRLRVGRFHAEAAH